MKTRSFNPLYASTAITTCGTVHLSIMQTTRSAFGSPAQPSSRFEGTMLQPAGTQAVL